MVSRKERNRELALLRDLAPTEAARTEARNLLVTENMGLVYSRVNNRYLFLTPSAREEAISAGLLALVESADRWNPDRGQFSSYACTAINGEMIQAIREAQYPLHYTWEAFGKNEDGSQKYPPLAEELTVNHHPIEPLTPELALIIKQGLAGLDENTELN